ncbi:hypothetical protein [Solitalea lacus]|uniref:hypothetical protein n=1 Tax=Solitalea lacus TaxID=2911172 RepID=UPI001EDBD375|nr:hypothetical protein [Solitalea lacus]UKJ06317.1 hypothetical protein L2B55_12300 [Solitalea lacus]
MKRLLILFAIIGGISVIYFVTQSKEFKKPNYYTASDCISVNAKYLADKTFGGISNVDLTLVNKVDEKFDYIEVKVDYIKENGEVFKSEIVPVQDMFSHDAKYVHAPDSPRGVSINVSISKAVSTELGTTLY